MSNDFSKLKRLATTADESVKRDVNTASFHWNAFRDVANPKLILALIAENDSAHKHWANESNNVQALTAEVIRIGAERDQLFGQTEQLKADNELLRTQAQDALTGQMAIFCDLDLFKMENECLKDEAIDHINLFKAWTKERDQFKSEVERLECMLENHKIDAKVWREAHEKDEAKNEALRYALKRIVKSTDGCFPVDHRIDVHVSTIALAKRTLWPDPDSPDDELDALRKDAERYRWLRDNSESVHQFYLSTPIWFTGVKFRKENVDSTIDAAISKEAKA